MSNYLLWITSVLVALIFQSLSTPYHYDQAFFLGNPHHDRLRVLLLTAHPDDECMFFAPTLLGLTQAPYESLEVPLKDKVSTGEVEPKTDVYSLCLSSGDADGLGEMRKRELNESLDVLGVAEGKRWVLDEPFHDNITLFWDAQLIAEHLMPFIEDNQIDTILTFDDRGISSHPNHISLERGVRVLLQNVPRNDIRAFALTTTSLLPKYTGALGALTSKLKQTICTHLSDSNDSSFFPYLPLQDILSRFVEVSCSKHDEENPNSSHALFVSGWSQYVTTLRAMQKHQSQLVWFRWLYVVFSRYMWVNEWKEIVISRN